MRQPIFFDYASTTPCCHEAIAAMAPFYTQDFGHPSSSHSFGQKAATRIREARLFFAQTFGVDPEQVVFTSGGTEADNLAIFGIALQYLTTGKTPTLAKRPRFLSSAIEHSAVKKPVLSLDDFGLEPKLIPVNAAGEIDRQAYLSLVDDQTQFISIHQVNNIIGARYPVEELAQLGKQVNPNLVFHTDAVQGFGRIAHPRPGSGVDLVSISSHKIEGPKGVGALIVLNKNLLKTGSRPLRPILLGGGQEGALRSGTPSPGLIAGFHAAAQMTLAKTSVYLAHTTQLRAHLRANLARANLLDKRIRWNSPDDALSHIINLSFPHLAAGPLARLLEERGCLVSTGSACSATKPEPEPVLAAMSLPVERQTSAIRISLSDKNTIADIDILSDAIQSSIHQMDRLYGSRR